MPTNKHRINLTVSDELDRTIQYLAERDESSASNKAIELIKRALEIEEDEALLTIANQRDQKNVKFISHKKAWG